MLSWFEIELHDCFSIYFFMGLFCSHDSCLEFDEFTQLDSSHLFYFFLIYFLEFHLSIFGCLRIKFHDLSPFALCEGYHGLIT
jgi:hypothetical protein